MKKVVLIVLALMLMTTCMAESTGWRDGLSPAKPYSGLPEQNLDEVMGYMMYMPKAGVDTELACRRLYIFLPREDVKAGSGTIYLLNEREGIIWQAVMNESESVSQKELEDYQLETLLWGGGTCFEIVLPKSLELGKTYFVNMTRGAIVTESGVESPEVGGKDAWTFTVEGDYGVNNLEYFNDSAKGIVNPKAGDEVRFDLVLNEEATVGMIYGDGVEFEDVVFEEAGELVGKVTADNPVWGVLFLDDSGNILNQVQFF